MNDVANTPESAAQHPEIEELEAELAADLEEVWQEESPDTARRTEVAEEVDGDPDTREVADEA